MNGTKGESWKNPKKEHCIQLFCDILWTCAWYVSTQLMLSSLSRRQSPPALTFGCWCSQDLSCPGHVLTVRMQWGILKLWNKKLLTLDITCSTTAQHLSQSLHPWVLDGLSALQHQRSLPWSPGQAKAWWKIPPISPFSHSLWHLLKSWFSSLQMLQHHGMSQIQTSLNLSTSIWLWCCLHQVDVHHLCHKLTLQACLLSGKEFKVVRAKTCYNIGDAALSEKTAK